MSSDALPDDTWINNFLASPPRPLQTNLQKRLHASTVHLNSLAELYKQRAAIETQYSESLAKLVRIAEQGNLLPKSGVEWDKASGEGKLWDALINEISEASPAHLLAAPHCPSFSPLTVLDFDFPFDTVRPLANRLRTAVERSTWKHRCLEEDRRTRCSARKGSQRLREDVGQAGEGCRKIQIVIESRRLVKRIEQYHVVARITESDGLHFVPTTG